MICLLKCASTCCDDPQGSNLVENDQSRIKNLEKNGAALMPQSWRKSLAMYPTVATWSVHTNVPFSSPDSGNFFNYFFFWFLNSCQCSTYYICQINLNTLEENNTTGMQMKVKSCRGYWGFGVTLHYCILPDFTFLLTIKFWSLRQDLLNYSHNYKRLELSWQILRTFMCLLMLLKYIHKTTFVSWNSWLMAICCEALLV